MSDATTTEQAKVTVGLDLGDRCCQICVLDEAGEMTEEGRVATKPEGPPSPLLRGRPLRIVLEAGTHSPWVSRLLAEFGHEAIVANPRKGDRPCHHPGDGVPRDLPSVGERAWQHTALWTA